MHSYICHVETKEFVRKEHVDHQLVVPQDLKTLAWAPVDYPIVGETDGERLKIALIEISN